MNDKLLTDYGSGRRATIMSRDNGRRPLSVQRAAVLADVAYNEGRNEDACRLIEIATNLADEEFRRRDLAGGQAPLLDGSNSSNK